MGCLGGGTRRMVAPPPRRPVILEYRAGGGGGSRKPVASRADGDSTTGGSCDIRAMSLTRAASTSLSLSLSSSKGPPVVELLMVVTEACESFESDRLIPTPAPAVAPAPFWENEPPPLLLLDGGGRGGRGRTTLACEYMLDDRDISDGSLGSTDRNAGFDFLRKSVVSESALAIAAASSSRLSIGDFVSGVYVSSSATWDLRLPLPSTQWPHLSAT